MSHQNGFSHHTVHPLTQSSSSVPCHSAFNFLWRAEPCAFPGRLECCACPNPSAVQAGTGHSSRVPCSSRWCWHMCCSDLENRAQESRHGLLKVTHFSHTVSSGRCPTQSHLGWKGVNYCIYCLNGVHNLIRPLKEDVSFSSWKSSFPINSLNYSPLVYHFTATSRVLSWTQ